jgi:hypothetical protein
LIFMMSSFLCTAVGEITMRPTRWTGARSESAGLAFDSARVNVDFDLHGELLSLADWRIEMRPTRNESGTRSLSARLAGLGSARVDVDFDLHGKLRERSGLRIKKLRRECDDQRPFSIPARTLTLIFMRTSFPVRRWSGMDPEIVEHMRCARVAQPRDLATPART